MEEFVKQLSNYVAEAFEQCNYEKSYGTVTLSNRPDLCQFQCNGALTAAKVYKKAPIQIAKEVAEVLCKLPYFTTVDCVMPGFINLNVSDYLIVDYLQTMQSDNFLGCKKIGVGQTIILDYGGPNVAKPLHVGHLRTAIIGESIKRMGCFLGYQVLGDVHLGDWGLPIGLIITELKKRSPDLPYFTEITQEAYPTDPPFTIIELEAIYPAASSYAKSHPEFMEEAKEATYLFQTGYKPYVALWEHILAVSIDDLKKNYARLNVYFDLWKKESDSQPYIPPMIDLLKKQGFAYESQGALVVDVKEATDTKEVPPCLLVKSDGATLYSTTDLATIVERVKLFQPDEIIYIVDKRQEMHFEQVFRCAKKASIVSNATKLTFLGFGTMNGKDGKPFKTRDGGVMRLEHLIDAVKDAVYEKVSSNPSISPEEAPITALKIGIAALKYGDLSNQIAKDYIFDLEKFTSFEGNTGPYLLYTVVRIQSILDKFHHQKPEATAEILLSPLKESERALMLKLTLFNEVMTTSFQEYAPHKICQYIYELSNYFNRFYHENKILSESNEKRQLSWVILISLTKKVLSTCLNLLAIDIPDKM